MKWGGLSRGDGPHVEEKAGRETGHAASCVGGTGGKEVAKVGGVGGIPEPRGGPQPDPPPLLPMGGPKAAALTSTPGAASAPGPDVGGGGVCHPRARRGGRRPRDPPQTPSLTNLPHPHTPPGGGGGVSPPPPAAPALAQVSGSGGGGGLSPAGGTPPAAPNWPRCPRRWSRARGGGGSER